MKIENIFEADDPEFATAIKKIRNMTNQNDHNGAMAAGLSLLGTDSLISDMQTKLKAIQRNQQRHGEMTGGDRSARRTIYDKMMQIAKKRLDMRQYKQFYDSF